MEKAAVYLRLSKEDADKDKNNSRSIENQKGILIDFAKKNKMEIFNIYTDDDFSGLYWERPAFIQLIDDAKEGLFNVVLAKTQSRLSRNMEHCEYIMHDLFPALGIRFIGVSDGVDTFDKSSKKSRQINALVNEWYSEDLSDNIRSVFKRKMEDGQYLGTYAPYGYKKKDSDHHELEIDIYASKWIKVIYDMYIKGYNIKEIIKLLESEKVLTPKEYLRMMNNKNYENKYLWSESTIKKILSNEMYTGKIIQGKSQRKSFKDKTIIYKNKNEWIVRDNMQEPIISEMLFEKAKKRREKRRCNKKC